MDKADTRYFDDASFIIERFLYKHNLSSGFELDFLRNHPAFPSMLALRDTLKFCGLNAEAYELKPEMMQQLERPFITVWTEKAGREEFVIIYAAEGKRLLLESSRVGKIKVSVSDFFQSWNGVVLLVDTHKAKKGESTFLPDSTTFRSQMRVFAYLILVLTSSWLVILHSTFFLRYYYLLLPLLAGLGVSCYLVKLQNTLSGSTLLDRVCGGTGKVDCKSVLGSNSAALMKGVSLAELALFYFLTSVATLSYSFILNVPIKGIIVLFAFILIGLVVCLYSVFLQLVVIKKWCLFCLAIVVSVIAEGILLYPLIKNIGAIPPLTPFLSHVFFLQGGLLGVLLLAKNHTAIKREKAAYLEQVNLLRSNRGYLEYVLAAGATLKGQPLSPELTLGNDRAQTEILAILSFQCPYCRHVYTYLMHLHQVFGEKIKIRIAFKPSVDAKSELHDLYYLYTLRGQESRKEFLNAWYHGNSTPKTLNEEQLEVWLEEWLAEREHFLKENNLDYTPAIFIDSQKMDKKLQLEDFTLLFSYRIFQMEYQQDSGT